MKNEIIDISPTIAHIVAAIPIFIIPGNPCNTHPHNFSITVYKPMIQKTIPNLQY